MSAGSTSRRVARRLSRGFEAFFALEAASAALLFAATAAALVWANLDFASYAHFWHTPLALHVGAARLELSLGHFVNDALMAIFFFVVGMEIKREMVRGELSSREKAMLPVAGALGGMIVPAAVYAAFHAGGPALRGVGIPMATDIAFAVAALSLLGPRVPSGLKVFLLALAIADDLGAVALIAVFYTESISLPFLAAAAAGLGLVYALNRAGVVAFSIYWVVGGAVWFATLQSGVHATVAGVFLGLLTPAFERDPSEESLLDRGRQAIERLRGGVRPERDPHGDERYQAFLALRRAGLDALSPLDYLVNDLHRWVAFLIMPVFALANAGVAIEAAVFRDPLALRVALAVALGLVVGKPLGITLLSWLAVKSGLAVLPAGVNWLAIAATGTLAGIGFTVALFIAALAFGDSPLVYAAKLGILVGSAAAFVLGIACLRAALPAARAPAPDNPPVR
jgi:NhaA family Na+:H+ antiporter